LAGEELRQSQERLQMAVESAALGTWDFNPVTSEFHWSDRCKSLFGIPNTTAVHYETFLSMIHPDDCIRVDEMFRSALKPGSTGNFAAEFRVLTRDDGILRWLMARGKAHFSDAWKPVRLNGTFLDVTQAKLSEQTLRKTEKLVTAGRMAATIAHEINNPLAAATNLLYLAKTDPEVGDEPRHYLEQAEQELARVAHITRQTLGFYRESASPTQVNIQKLIESVLLIYRKKFESKQIKIEREYRGPVTVEAIEGEVRQVLSNLLTNAADAVPMRGTIWVRTAVSLLRTGEAALRISVADNGKGISPDHSHHIFEPFFTTKDSVGTGLGLWVAKQIIEKHGGRIAFRSRTGIGSSGTLFSIFLPLKLSNRLSA
jgi:PAS domain S-box-containing protein